MKKSRNLIALLLMSIALLGLFLVDVVTAERSVSFDVPPILALKIVASHILPFLHLKVDPFLNFIVWESRVPMAIGGVIVGALLAMAGVAFQSLLRNPLADPYMIGVSAGSALGSVLVVLLGGAGLMFGLLQPAAAFGAGLLTMTVVYQMSRYNGRLSTQSFLLAGIVVGTFMWSLLQLSVAVALRSHDPGKAQTIIAQQLGNLGGVSWLSLGLLLPFGIIGMIVLAISWRELNLMALGGESAAHLGVNTEGFKRKVILAGSLVTAATVSTAGIIAFVGMIVPHIARRLVGPDHRFLLPASMLLGGLTLLFALWLSRVFLNGLEIGVITSLMGAPLFCYLLRQKGSK